MSEREIDVVAFAMRFALRKARRPDRHTLYELRIMAEAARSALLDLHDEPPAPMLSPYGDLCSPVCAEASLRDDLIAAGAANWRGVLDADGQPVRVGRYVVRHKVFVTGDYLPFDLHPGCAVSVQEVFPLFDNVRVRIENHLTGARIALVPAASLGAM